MSSNRHKSQGFRPDRDIQGQYLLVVPKDLIVQWRTELATRVKGDLKIVVYHPGPEDGHSINRSPFELSQADIVITTHETVRSDFDEMRESEASFMRSHGRQWLGHYPLLVIYWLGVFFDEGHRLFNNNTSTSQGAQALRSLFKLPISSTPVQNDYVECDTILNILQIQPFCNTNVFREVHHIIRLIIMNTANLSTVLFAATTCQIQGAPSAIRDSQRSPVPHFPIVHPTSQETEHF
jgi:SNF2 family DNA or RNA helicase